MAARRFVAPARSTVPTACWQAQVFAGFSRCRAWFDAPQWPAVSDLSLSLVERRHAVSGVPLGFVEQDAELLADGLHYEQRIFERGGIATRAGNWHDLFNAAVWAEQNGLKSVLNARQYADWREVGARVRTRGQCALTQFDEAGAVVVLSDPALLALWDRHDWPGLFWDARSAWIGGEIKVSVFGHALLEHALLPEMLLVAKCLVVLAPECGMDAAQEHVAAAILAGEVLQDPQELRPLPLSGIPGWHPRTDDASFYGDAPCFRPVRAGRRYPAPLTRDIRR